MRTIRYRIPVTPDINTFYAEYRWLDCSSEIQTHGHGIRDPKQLVDEITYHVRLKYRGSDILRRKLLETGDAFLRDGFSNDPFWGMVWDKKAETWRGENHLGNILMQIRRELTS